MPQTELRSNYTGKVLFECPSQLLMGDGDWREGFKLRLNKGIFTMKSLKKHEGLSPWL